jgi:hypothetical protein
MKEGQRERQRDRQTKGGGFEYEKERCVPFLEMGHV